jgi:hypothetical protein
MQEFKFKVVGDTKPAVAANEALDASINKIDDSTKQLDASTKKLGSSTEKTGLDAQKAFGAQLDSKIKATDSRIKTITGTIGLATGAISTVVGALGLIGIEDEQLAGFQKATLSVLALGSGAAQAITGFKDLTEAKKLANEVAIAASAITRTETAAEVANTAATVTNTTATVAGTAATNTANTATKAFNATLLTNPYVLVAAAVAALSAGIYFFIKAQNSSGNAIGEYNKRLEKTNELEKLRLGNKETEAQLEIRSARLLKGDIAALQTEKSQTRKDILDERKNLLAQQRVLNAANLEAAELKIKAERIKAQIFEGQIPTNALVGLGITAGERLATKLEQIKLFQEGITSSELKIQELQLNEIELAGQITKALVDNKEKLATSSTTASEKAAKAAEELAKRAVKQLEDERQATEDLIDLYTELYPEKVTGGQFEFNTELDRTNFALKEQLDVLYSLSTVYEDLGDQLEEFTDDVGESFFSEKQLEVFKKLRDSQKTGLQLQLEDLENTYRSDLLLFTDNEEMKSQITEQYEADRAKTVRQYAIQNAQAVLGITSQFLNTIAQVNQASLELQLAQAAGNQAAINQINADALEQQKKLRIAQVLVTTAESVLNGFNATSTLPPPFNFIAGAALAAAYTALGAKSIQTINATTLEGGGGGGGFNNIPSGGGFSLPGGGGVSTTPSLGALLPGLGGGRIATPSIGTVAEEPIRAYVLSGDVSNGMQAGIALNNRRRLSGG